MPTVRIDSAGTFGARTGGLEGPGNVSAGITAAVNRRTETAYDMAEINAGLAARYAELDDQNKANEAFARLDKALLAQEEAWTDKDPASVLSELPDRYAAILEDAINSIDSERVQRKFAPLADRYITDKHLTTERWARGRISSMADDQTGATIATIRGTGALMDPHELDLAITRAQQQVDAMRAVNHANAAGRQAELDIARKTVMTTRTREVIDGDLAARTGPDRIRLSGAVQSFEAFQQAYGPYATESMWKQARGGLDAIVNRELGLAKEEQRYEAAQQRDAAREAKADAREVKAAQAEVVFDWSQQWGQLSDQIERTRALVSADPTVQVPWRMLIEQEDQLRASAPADHRVERALSKTIDRRQEITALQAAQSTLHEDGLRSFLDQAAVVLGDESKPAAERNAWRSMASSLQGIVARDGLDEAARRIAGIQQSAPLWDERARAQAALIRQQAPAAAGVTEKQLQDLGTAVLEGNGLELVERTRRLWSFDERAGMADKLARMKGFREGSTESVLHGLLTTDMPRADMQAALNGLQAQKGGQWIRTPQVVQALGSHWDRYREMFPNPGVGPDAADEESLAATTALATAIYLGRGGSADPAQLDRDDYDKAFEAALGGSPVTLNGRRTVIPAGKTPGQARADVERLTPEQLAKGTGGAVPSWGLPKNTFGPALLQKIQVEARAVGLPADVAVALVAQENGAGDIKAVGTSGELGLTQVLPSTGPEAARLAGETWDPKRMQTDEGYSLRLGFAYLREQLRNAGGDTRGAFRRYNGAGPQAEAYADRAMGRLRDRNQMTSAQLAEAQWVRTGPNRYRFWSNGGYVRGADGRILDLDMRLAAGW